MTGLSSDVKSLGWYLDCVQNEAIDMMEKFHIPTNHRLPYNQTCMGDPGHADAWGIPIPSPYFFSGINYLGLLIVAVFIIVLLVELLCCTKARGFGQGRYITFTYTVQNSFGYKFCAAIIVVFCALILIDQARFLIRALMHGAEGRVRNFISYLALSLVTLCYSSISLMQGAAIEDPFFDYTTEEFKDLQFKRGWTTIFNNNEVFAKHLGVLLLQYKYGNTKPLRKICTSTIDEVSEALTPVTDTQ